MGRTHRAALLRVTTAACAAGRGCWPRLVPGPDGGGAGKQNAVVVIVVRRYADFVAGVGLVLLHPLF